MHDGAGRSSGAGTPDLVALQQSESLIINKLTETYLVRSRAWTAYPMSESTQQDGNHAQLIQTPHNLGVIPGPMQPGILTTSSWTSTS